MLCTITELIFCTLIQGSNIFLNMLNCEVQAGCVMSYVTTLLQFILIL